MYIKNLENHLFKVFEHKYISKINEILEKYLSINIFSSNILTFKEISFELSNVTIILIKDLYEVIGYDNCEILESIKVEQNNKESNIANLLNEYISEYIKDVREILFSNYEIKRKTYYNNKIQFSKEIKKSEINKTWSKDSENNIATKLDYSFDTEIEEISSNNIVWNEHGYFSIIENLSDEGTFFTIFQAEM